MLKPNDLLQNKANGCKITMVTVYDYPFAQMAEQVGIDLLLVGDSGANVVLGYESTRQISMKEMLTFVAAVRRGAPSQHIVADLPYLADKDIPSALENSQKFLQAGANSVKLEGARFDIVSSLVQNQIPVIGHLGLLPQTATSFKKAAKTQEEQNQILADALQLQQRGICALVLEHVPNDFAQKVSQSLNIPVIGIGAGPYCDGQVMVLHDLLGISAKVPSIAFPFGDLRKKALTALSEYVAWVHSSSDLDSLRINTTQNQTEAPYGC